MKENEPQIPYGYRRHFPKTSTDIATPTAVWIPTGFRGLDHKGLTEIGEGWANPRNFHSSLIRGLMIGNAIFIEPITREGYELVPLDYGCFIPEACDFLAIKADGSELQVKGSIWMLVSVKNQYVTSEWQAVLRPVTAPVEAPVEVVQARPAVFIGANKADLVAFNIRLIDAIKERINATESWRENTSGSIQDLLDTFLVIDRLNIEGLEKNNEILLNGARMEEPTQEREWPPVFEGYEFVGFADPQGQIPPYAYGLSNDGGEPQLWDRCPLKETGLDELIGYIRARGPLYKKVVGEPC